MNRIILTGPECSGKTTLVMKLAKHFDVHYAEEYAVSYLKLKPKYEFTDLEAIAIGQHYSECALTLHEHFKGKDKIVLCDTDILTVQIWSEVVFKKVSSEIKRMVKNMTRINKDNNIYLLCSPEGIDWEFHPQRENPNDRDKLFERYEELLKKLNFPYFVLRGDIETRFNKAVKIIEKNV